MSGTNHQPEDRSEPYALVRPHLPPLYYWKDDTKAGDVLGQKVGGVWFVLDRDGAPITK